MSTSSIRGNSVYFGTRSTQNGHSSSELPATPVHTETSQSAAPYILDFSPIHIPDEPQPPSYEASVNRTANQSQQGDIPEQEVIRPTDTFSRLNTIPLARLAPQASTQAYPQNDQIDNIELQELGAVAIPVYEALPAYPGIRQEPQSTNFFSAAAAHKKALAIFSMLLGTVFSSFTWAIASATMNQSCNQPNLTPTPAPTYWPSPSFPTFPPFTPFPPLPTLGPLPTLNPRPTTNPLPPHDGDGQPDSPGTTGNAGNAGSGIGAGGNAGDETEDSIQAGSAAGGAIGNTASSGTAFDPGKNEADASDSEQATSQTPCDITARNSTEVP